MTDASPVSRPSISLRYDLRSAPFGRPHTDIYAAMLEHVRWAERNGAASVTFSEHHAADDGYLPSPIVAAAAAAGASSSLRIRIAALLIPLYDSVRLAEDLAVLDQVSGGRIDLVIGVGYRPEEYELHGRPFRGRFSEMERQIEFLRAAWSGTACAPDGTHLAITPLPSQPGGPRIFLGGASVAAARRAARIADGFCPVADALVQPYLDACAETGRTPDVVSVGAGPMFVHVSNDPERDWVRIAPHALHETNSYGRWIANAGGTGPYREMADAAALRASGSYAVLTPDECVELAISRGQLVLHPLMGGLDPDLAAESLALVESSVLPRL